MLVFSTSYLLTGAQRWYDVGIVGFLNKRPQLFAKGVLKYQEVFLIVGADPLKKILCLFVCLFVG